MSRWEEVLLTLGEVTVIVGVLGFVARSLFRSWLEKGLAEHRIRLQAQHDQAIEQMRAELKLAETEHEVRFRHLHEKVAETVAETYARLQEFYSAVASYVSEFEFAGEPSKEEKLESANQAGEKFRRYFLPRRIYFEQAMAVRVMEFSRQLIKAARDCKRGQEARSTAQMAGKDPWGKAVERMETVAEPLFRELEELFRQLIGMKIATPPGRSPEESS